MFVNICLIILAYLIGALSGSLIIGRLLGQADVRGFGSGNAGATNALRAGGRSYGLTVLLFDLVKGVIAALLLPWLLSAPAWVGYACGAAAVIGHVYPVYFGFRGGKGAATLIGVLLVVAFWPLLVGLMVWGMVLVLTGFVGLATILGMMAVAAILIATLWPALISAPVVFGIAMWLLIVFTHRDNIRRMADGTEHRFERAMLFRRSS